MGLQQVSRFARLIACVFLFTTYACGCRDTLNVSSGDLATYGPQITAFTVTPSDPAGFFGGNGATFSVSFQNGTPPYTVSIDFGGAAQPNVLNQPATSPYSTTVTLIDFAAAQSFTAYASITDATGISANPQSLTFNIGATRGSPDDDVDETPGGIPPSIDSAVTVNGLCTVQVTDLDKDLRSIVLLGSSGDILGGLCSEQIDSDSGTALFEFSAADYLRPAMGKALFKATDHRDNFSTREFDVQLPGLVIAPDTLYALPGVTRCNVEDTVKMTIRTGAMANPFQFMTGVSVIFPTGCEYSENSFDYGSPAAGDAALNPVAEKDQETKDGVWRRVNPTDEFLLVADNFLVPDTDLPEPYEGLSAIDFNVTPLAADDIIAGSSGDLFNFNLRFTEAGAYKLRFLLFDEVSRTYYQDGSQQQYKWADLSNPAAVAIVVSDAED